MTIWKAQLDEKRVARIARLVPGIVANRLVFRPEKWATTFGSVADATIDQCRALAGDKLKEAIAAVDSSLATQ